MLSQQVSGSWADKMRQGTRNVGDYEVVVDGEGRSMWRTTSPIVTEVLMPAVSATAVGVPELQYNVERAARLCGSGATHARVYRLA